MHTQVSIPLLPPLPSDEEETQTRKRAQIYACVQSVLMHVVVSGGLDPIYITPLKRSQSRLDPLRRQPGIQVGSENLVLCFALLLCHQPQLILPQWPTSILWRLEKWFSWKLEANCNNELSSGLLFFLLV